MGSEGTAREGVEEEGGEGEGKGVGGGGGEAAQGPEVSEAQGGPGLAHLRSLLGGRPLGGQLPQLGHQLPPPGQLRSSFVLRIWSISFFLISSSLAFSFSFEANFRMIFSFATTWKDE